ncbi:MAG: FHA domain-containing protein [Xanthomonadales bacterium]|nr:FHA domain-containing protein [Xanthomonadales bacterium]NIX13313.1 FHA domain-containing protein [Xanthomonadales bacterium]
MAVYRLKGTAGEVVNRNFPLSGRLLIGRSDDCDVRIDDRAVAARHAAVLVLEDGSVTLRNLDPGFETQLNGEPVESARLAGGDEIRIGTCRWMLQAPGLRPDRVLTAAATVRPRAHWPWLLAVALAAATALAWQRGWLIFPGS